MIEFASMPTRDDVTVRDAAAVPASRRESGLRSVGFEDAGPPPGALAEVTAAAHEAETAAHAAEPTAMEDVHGVDRLAHRHATEDPIALTRAVADGPVIAAGSVSSFEQIAALEAARAWGFTIGSAIFANRLPGRPSVPGQIAAVLAVAA